MDKIPFHISAEKQGTKALIRIIGHIGWDTDSEIFRTQVDLLVSQGINDVHLYVNSEGGSCFDAAEIVNILSSFKGEITGEGGALVASAATYIAVHCKTFSMPANGQFMVHKPKGGNWGTADDMESYLKLLKNIENDYYDTYKAVVKDVAAFDEKWKKGDYWMTAKEAKEQGFITEVKEKIKIDKETATMIQACGCPNAKQLIQTNNKNETKMDVKTTALMLGLPETASEAEVKAKLEENKKAAADLEAMKAENVRKEKEERAKKVKAALEKAIADKRIKADAKTSWEAMLNADYDNAIVALEAIQSVEKLSTQIKVEASGGKKTYQGKTFEQLQDENPDALSELQTNDPEAFDEIFDDYKKRNKLK